MSCYGLVNSSAGSLAAEASRFFASSFATDEMPLLVSVPGRVNLIGEHIDYHNLPVLPVALQRSIWIAFRPRSDARIRAVSASQYGMREFTVLDLEASTPGDWSNYLKAAAQAVSSRWPLMRGIDAAIVSDLPAAAGLASSSALLVAMTLALLEANSILATLGELMDILPEGEQFVGTRGGGMDHAAVLASRAASALLVQFAPLGLLPVAIPGGWCFLVGHSMTAAEKSAGVRAEYNAKRAAGTSALKRLELPSYAEALKQHSADELKNIVKRALAEERLSLDEARAFLHVTTETRRVEEAVTAMQRADLKTFGKLLLASHASLRDELRVSSPALDELVEAAISAGAMGARLTGAGFGGCVVMLCRAKDRERVCGRIRERYYAKRSGFDPKKHLFAAQPSPGALYNTRRSHDAIAHNGQQTPYARDEIAHNGQQTPCAADPAPRR